MASPSKVGRNDPCSCGSGKKFKNCCANKAQGLSTVGWVTLGAIAVAAAVIVYFVALAPRDDGVRLGRNCPPGSTWQHGHCHFPGGR